MCSVINVQVILQLFRVLIVELGEKMNGVSIVLLIMGHRMLSKQFDQEEERRKEMLSIIIVRL